MLRSLLYDLISWSAFPNDGTLHNEGTGCLACVVVCVSVLCVTRRPSLKPLFGMATQDKQGMLQREKKKKKKNHTSIQSIRTTAAHNLDDHRDSHLGIKPNGNGISQGREVLGWWGIK